MREGECRFTTKSKEDGILSKAKHPGEILQQIMEERGISIRSLACMMGVNTSQLCEIIDGKRQIKRTTAIKLADCLDIDAKFWLNLQEKYLGGIKTSTKKWTLWNPSSSRHKVSLML